MSPHAIGSIILSSIIALSIEFFSRSPRSPLRLIGNTQVPAFRYIASYVVKHERSVHVLPLSGIFLLLSFMMYVFLGLAEIHTVRGMSLAVTLLTAGIMMPVVFREHLYNHAHISHAIYGLIVLYLECLTIGLFFV